MSSSGPPADAKQAQAAALAELDAALKRKRAVDASLVNLENSIYNFEDSYLQETAASGGNIIKGFDNYLKPINNNTKKKSEVTETDRLFSTSSGTYQQSLEAKAHHDYVAFQARIEQHRRHSQTLFQPADHPSPAEHGTSTPNATSELGGEGDDGMTVWECKAPSRGRGGSSRRGSASRGRNRK